MNRETLVQKSHLRIIYNKKGFLKGMNYQQPQLNILTLRKDQIQVAIRFIIPNNICQIRDNPIITLKCKIIFLIQIKHKLLILKYPDIKINQKLESVCKKTKKLYQIKMCKCKLRTSLFLRNSKISKELINHILLTKNSSNLLLLSLKKEEKVGEKVSDEILMQLIFQK